MAQAECAHASCDAAMAMRPLSRSHAVDFQTPEPWVLALQMMAVIAWIFFLLKYVAAALTRRWRAQDDTIEMLKDKKRRPSPRSTRRVILIGAAKTTDLEAVVDEPDATFLAGSRRGRPVLTRSRSLRLRKQSPSLPVECRVLVRSPKRPPRVIISLRPSKLPQTQQVERMLGDADGMLREANGLLVQNAEILRSVCASENGDDENESQGRTSSSSAETVLSGDDEIS